jgi:uncharacterized phage protein (TIGR01671 family)
MREIKFRTLANDGKGNSEWFYYGTQERLNIPIKYQFIKVSDSQYTGLTDRNGKEVYEGDILPCADKVNGKVIYEEGFCAYSVEYPNYKQLLMDYKADYYEGFEVIGNIYENPELLEVSS